MIAEGEAELWRAVVMQAVQHARGVGLGIIPIGQRPVAVAEARRWLLRDRSLHMVCDMAGVEAETLRRWAQEQPWAQEQLAA